MQNIHRTARRPSRGSARISLLAGCALGAILAHPAMAADADPSATPTERITVTGTRIIRTGMVTPTPVTTVQAAEIDRMAPGTVLESLSELPTFFANQVPEQVNGGQNSGGSNLNLRGAGNNRTLVLLDGRRVVSSNRFGTVDIAQFPEELLQSVETVTGGASASYGTDAVAGVVNFILDTDFEGVKAHGQYGVTRYGDGENYEIGAAFGARIGDRGHLLGSVELYNLEAISSFESLTDRDFYKQHARVGSRILPNVIPTNWNQTGIINAPGTSLNQLVFNPDGSTSILDLTGAVVSGTSAALPTQNYGVDVDDEVAAGNERMSAFLYYEHELTNNLRVYGQLLAGETEVSDRRENVAFVAPTWAPRVFADNAYLPADVALAIQNEGTVVAGSNGVPSVQFALFGVNNGENGLEDVRQITINELVSATVGFEYEIDTGGFLDGWVARGYYQHGENDQSFDTDNGIRVDRTPLAFDAVRHPVTDEIVCHVSIIDPVNFGDCAPMNIFGGVQNMSAAARDYIVDDYKHAIQHVEQDWAEFVMSGDLWRGFGAGPVSGAIGASYRKEELDQSTPDPTDEFPTLGNGTLMSDAGLLPAESRGIIPQNLPNGIPGVRNVPGGFTGDANSSSVTFSSLRAITGEADVSELFGELNVPLFADQPWADQLDINMAARWADYSGSGVIWAWKYGASWQINQDVRLRATQSRDVRAANLRERFDQTRGGANVLNPWRPDPVTTLPSQESTASLSGGNETVSPEEADTTTIGVVYQPSFVDGLGISLDWYKIEIGDAINQLGTQTVIQSCFANGDLCQFVIRDAQDFILRVENLFFNVETQVVEGIDLEASYARGPFDFRLFATYQLENSITQASGAFDERVGDLSQELGIPEYKLSGMLGYTRDRFSAFVQERYISDGVMNRPFENVTNVDNAVDGIFYTDVGASYRLGENEQVELFGNIDNLLDQEPRVTAGPVGRAGTDDINEALYDVLGRRFTVGVRVRF
jgi:outer membrane receptor protein involved in Fe transport